MADNGQTMREARTAVYTRFKAAWDDPTNGWAGSGLDDEPQVFYDNIEQEGEPDAAAPYIRVSAKPIFGDIAGFGDTTKLFTRTGLVQVEIFTPKDRGTALADDLMQVVLDAFEGKRAGGVVFLRVTPSEGRGLIGAHWRSLVSADFEWVQRK